MTSTSLRTLALPLALAAALCATAARADSTAHNGWQCSAGKASVDLHYWLARPQAEPGVTVTDSLPVSALLDSAFKYSFSPTIQLFSFRVRLGSDHRIVRDGATVPWQSLKVEIGDGTKVLASGAIDRSREFTLLNSDALPLAQALTNPATKNLVVRLLDGAGVPLASYSVPSAGFASAGQAAGAMMGTAGTEGIGKSCA